MTESLRLLTYNVKGLPGYAGGITDEQGREIARKIIEAGHDVVCLQEIFRATLREAIQEEFDRSGGYELIPKAGGDSTRALWCQDSGLFFACRKDRFEILDTNFQVYSDWDESGWPWERVDKWADKGILGVTLKPAEGSGGSHYLHVFVTHAQSGGHPEAVAAREKQFAQAGRMINSVLFCNDDTPASNSLTYGSQITLRDAAPGFVSAKNSGWGYRKALYYGRPEARGQYLTVFKPGGKGPVKFHDEIHLRTRFGFVRTRNNILGRATGDLVPHGYAMSSKSRFFPEEGKAPTSTEVVRDGDRCRIRNHKGYLYRGRKSTLSAGGDRETNAGFFMNVRGRVPQPTEFDVDGRMITSLSRVSLAAEPAGSSARWLSVSETARSLDYVRCNDKAHPSAAETFEILREETDIGPIWSGDEVFLRLADPDYGREPLYIREVSGKRLRVHGVPDGRSRFTIERVPPESDDPIDHDRAIHDGSSVYIRNGHGYLHPFESDGSAYVGLGSRACAWKIRLREQGPLPFVSVPHDRAGAVLLGDLNVVASRVREYGEMLRRLGSPRDLWPEWANSHPREKEAGNTHPSDDPVRRLDYVMAYDSFPLSKSRLLRLEIGGMRVLRDWKVSDHLPVEVELLFPAATAEPAP